MIKKIVYNDAYRPHTFKEISALLAPEVAATLDPDKEYGVQWYNRQRVTERTVSEPDAASPSGRSYRKTRTFKWRPREEWIAAPVPAHVSRSLVDLARSAMDGRSGRERKYQSRPWELRGLMRCRCGRKMQTRTTQLKSGHRYYYYLCPRAGKRAYTCKQSVLGLRRSKRRFGISSAGCSSIQSAYAPAWTDSYPRRGTADTPTRSGRLRCG
jgi:hypothetical protein